MEKVLSSVTEQITILIDDGTSARRPWDEVREEMDQVNRQGLADVREILSPEDFERFGEISRTRGTALSIPGPKSGGNGKEEVKVGP